MNALLAVAIGAAIGAPLRFGVERLVTAAAIRRRLAFPWALLVVNVVGSLIAGLIVRLADPQWQVLLLVGWCGAFTTFSGLIWQLDRLRAEDRHTFWLALVAIPGLSIVGFWAAWALG